MPPKLKILVPVKRVIDYQIKPLVNSSHTGVVTQGVKFSINPFDDIAVEEALRVQTRLGNDAVETHAVSIGDAKSKDILRNCLAKGINDVTLIDAQTASATLEPLAIAKVLTQFIRTHHYDLVILGKQAIDDDSNNVGQMIAGLLDWAQATNACKVDISSSDPQQTVTVNRETDTGEEVLKCKLPLVITTDLRLNTPRYVGLPKLMKVKRKPIRTLSLEDDFKDIDTKPQLTVLSVDQPPKKEPGVMVKSVDELISKLKEDKVI